MNNERRSVLSSLLGGLAALVCWKPSMKLEAVGVDYDGQVKRLEELEDSKRRYIEKQIKMVVFGMTDARTKTWVHKGLTSEWDAVVSSVGWRDDSKCWSIHIRIRKYNVHDTYGTPLRRNFTIPEKCCHLNRAINLTERNLYALETELMARYDYPKTENA